MVSRRSILLGLSGVVATGYPVTAQAQGFYPNAKPYLRWEGNGTATLLRKFAYRDRSGRWWRAPAGITTDGASIPQWAQSFVGGSWDTNAVNPAIIHDWFCVATVRPWAGHASHVSRRPPAFTRQSRNGRLDVRSSMAAWTTME